jgi:hypothetical protein
MLVTKSYGKSYDSTNKYILAEDTDIELNKKETAFGFLITKEMTEDYYISKPKLLMMGFKETEEGNYKKVYSNIEQCLLEIFLQSFSKTSIRGNK